MLIFRRHGIWKADHCSQNQLGCTCHEPFMQPRLLDEYSQPPQEASSWVRPLLPSSLEGLLVGAWSNSQALWRGFWKHNPQQVKIILCFLGDGDHEVLHKLQLKMETDAVLSQFIIMWWCHNRFPGGLLNDLHVSMQTFLEDLVASFPEPGQVSWHAWICWSVDKTNIWICPSSAYCPTGASASCPW